MLGVYIWIGVLISLVAIGFFVAFAAIPNGWIRL